MELASAPERGDFFSGFALFHVTNCGCLAPLFASSICCLLGHTDKHRHFTVAMASCTWVVTAIVTATDGDCAAGPWTREVWCRCGKVRTADGYYLQACWCWHARCASGITVCCYVHIPVHRIANIQCCLTWTVGPREMTHKMMRCVAQTFHMQHSVGACSNVMKFLELSVDRGPTVPFKPWSQLPLQVGVPKPGTVALV